VTAHLVRLATRGSPLARWQADHVAALLQAADPAVTVEQVVVDTVADRRLDVPIWQMGGKGVFVKEVQAAILDGRADLAVHSAKDLPSLTPDGLVLACVPERGDPRDALVGARLYDLRPGATVATGSIRRRAQLSWLRPDLTFLGLRGNIATRLRTLDEGGGGMAAIVMAVAALERLGLADRIAETLDPADVLPQVGQGALAVECSAAAPPWLRAALAAAEHPATRVPVDAERAFLAELGGGCDLPAGAHACLIGAHQQALRVEGMLASPDGHVLIRHVEEGPRGDAELLGRRVATHLLDHAGGRALLEG
jgi:hydroxymethylbilane synthase